MEGAYGTVTGTYEEIAGKLKALIVSSPAALQAKMTELKGKMTDREDVAKEEIEEKLRIANENVDVLEKIYDETDDKETKEMILISKATAESLREQYQKEFNAFSE